MSVESFDRYVWAAHPELVWVAARVHSTSGNVTTLKTVTDEVVNVATDALSEMIPVQQTTLNRVYDNLVDLDEFGEGAILHQLRCRYLQDRIYTFIGSILVSINPYKLLPLYTNSVMEKYRKKTANDTVPPHSESFVFRPCTLR
eukprot:TRINITY_DN11669_c0_g1_i1.p1 TRINITY_DN11669_c0_g1~~TRINITY_DN11669_c0_g1_i1.p1  ORF type:complete len:144 (-),score=8.80 TRINITY_DN11669_c0_g1_i1:12-443(-)